MNTLASEWLKIRSVRSTYLNLVLSMGGILLGLAVAWTAAGMYDSAPPHRRPQAALAEVEEVVVIVPQLCMGILGALAFTSEHVSGMLKTSFTVVPRRWPVLMAKSVVVGLLGLLAGTITVFGTHFLCRLVIGDRFSGIYTTPVFERLPTLVTTSLSVPVFALLGLGAGAILRSTAGAVSTLVGLAYVIPMICGNLPEPWSERLGSVMIGGLPRQITQADLTNSVYGSLLPPWAAAIIMIAYAAVPVTVGTLLSCRRAA